MATGTIDDPVNEEMLKQEGIPPGLSAEDAHNLQGKKEENLEEKVSAFSFKSMFDLAATAALGIYTGGLINYASVAGVYALVNWVLNKSKTTKEGILSEFKTGGIVTVQLGSAFTFLNYMKSFGTGLVSQFGYSLLGISLILPAFNLVVHTADYFFKSGKSLLNYIVKPWKIFSYFGELYRNRLKTEYLSSTASSYLVAPLIAAIPIATPLLHLEKYEIATSSAVRYAYRMSLGGGNEGKDADNRSFSKYLAEDYFTWPADARKKREDEAHKKTEQDEKNKQQQQQQMLQQMMQGQGAR